MVVCGDGVVVTPTHNAVAMDDVAATDSVVVAATVVVWVQRCWMRACTSP